MAPPSTGDDADALLAGLEPAMRTLVDRLREAVREHVPDVEERANLGWEGFGYHAPDAGYVLGLFPRDRFVEIGFEHGVDLEDPTGLFYRGGEQMRWVRFDEWDGERVEALLALLDQAIAERGR